MCFICLILAKNNWNLKTFFTIRSYTLNKDSNTIMEDSKALSPLFVNLKINPNLFIKDPVQTELGRKIIEQSVLLMDGIGLENFTFKKLAAEIGSTEASVYRYFENKHQLFVYLLNWYWEWMAVRIDLNTLNIKDPEERLRISLHVIVETANINTAIEFVNEEVLHRLVIREGAKGYHHKLVDADNKEGFFLAYKTLCAKIAAIILEINPDFEYPRSLASTLVELGGNNLYYAKHLPRLTDLDGSKKDLTEDVVRMLEYFAFNLITNPVSSTLNTPHTVL
jgi:AcrR family transcriptional regulator